MAIPHKDRQGALYHLACIFSDVSYENSLKYDRYPLVVFVIPSKNLRRNLGTISVRYCPITPIIPHFDVFFKGFKKNIGGRDLFKIYKYDVD